MKVLIIGASGGVGHRVASRLVAAGHRATALVRRREQAETFSAQGIDAVVGDVARDTVEALEISSRDMTRSSLRQAPVAGMVLRPRPPSMERGRGRSRRR